MRDVCWNGRKEIGCFRNEENTEKRFWIKKNEQNKLEIRTDEEFRSLYQEKPEYYRSHEEQQNKIGRTCMEEI